MFKPSSEYFTDHFKVVLLLWILFVIYVSRWDRADLLAHLCVMFPCVFYHFPIWYLGSGVGLDCIDS